MKKVAELFKKVNCLLREEVIGKNEVAVAIYNNGIKAGAGIEGVKATIASDSR